MRACGGRRDIAFGRHARLAGLPARSAVPEAGGGVRRPGAGGGLSGDAPALSATTARRRTVGLETLTDASGSPISAASIRS